MSQSVVEVDDDVFRKVVAIGVESEENTGVPIGPVRARHGIVERRGRRAHRDRAAVVRNRIGPDVAARVLVRSVVVRGVRSARGRRAGNADEDHNADDQYRKRNQDAARPADFPHFPHRITPRRVTPRATASRRDARSANLRNGQGMTSMPSSASSCGRGLSPSEERSRRPLRNRPIIGMLCTPYSCASFGSSSMLTFTTL
jgi:hypothetical protein